MDFILEIFVLITTIASFIILMDFRKDIKRVIKIMISFSLLAFTVYWQLAANGFDKEIISFLCFSIPSLGLCWYLAKYRDSRFIFTFCSVDLLALIIVIIGRLSAIPFNDMIWIRFGVTTVLLFVYINLVKGFKDKFKPLLRNVKTGWVHMALASILMYMLTFLLVAYPEPLRLRREYVPVIIVYVFTVLIIYRLIYQTVSSKIKIYDEQLENSLLKMKVELQESQLELQSVYYDMAYKDGLTGLKNRAALEKDMISIKSKSNQKIACVTMDLNNLKVINDQHGHQEGDRLIIGFVGALTKAFDKTDLIYRTGGDEFVAFFLDVQVMNNQVMKLEETIVDINRTCGRKIEYAIGYSVGKCHALEALMKHTDFLMYEDKREKKEA